MNDFKIGTIWWCPREHFIYHADTPFSNDDVQVKCCVEYDDYWNIKEWIEYNDIETLDEVKEVVRNYFKADYNEGLRSEYFENQRKEQMIKTALDYLDNERK